MSDEIPDSTRQARDVRFSTESLLPDDWQALAPLVDAVLDAPPERRADVPAIQSRPDVRSAAWQPAVPGLAATCRARRGFHRPHPGNRLAVRQGGISGSGGNGRTLPEMSR
jgi:hypothetical protein